MALAMVKKHLVNTITNYIQRISEVEESSSSIHGNKSYAAAASACNNMNYKKNGATAKKYKGWEKKDKEKTSVTYIPSKEEHMGQMKMWTDIKIGEHRQIFNNFVRKL